MLARAAAALVRAAQQNQPFGVSSARSLTAAAAAATSTNATQAPTITLPDAPTALTGTSASIATFVWQIAAKENVLDQVQGEIHQVAEAIKGMPELTRLAVDPFIPTKTRVKVIESLFQGAKVSPITSRLFTSLAEENALAATLQIADAYDELMLAHKKEVHCNVITAEPLDKLEREELTKKAAKFVDPGFKLVTQEKVDKRILGGFILEFEDRRVDMSVSKKLEEFNNLVFRLESELK
jgi:F-type H+-transporting ATPase subunit O